MKTWISKVMDFLQGVPEYPPSNYSDFGEIRYRLAFNGYDDQSVTASSIPFPDDSSSLYPMIHQQHRKFSQKADQTKPESENLGEAMFYILNRLKWKSPGKLVIHFTNRSYYKSANLFSSFTGDSQTPEKAVLEFANRSIFYYLIHLNPSNQKMATDFSETLSKKGKSQFFETIPEGSVQNLFRMAVIKTLVKLKSPMRS